MTFRKFVAGSTRDCLRMMRDALGADAMIVSTRRTAEGVEIVGVRAADMPSLTEAADAAPAEHALSAMDYLGETDWADMGEESVQLSAAARVLAQHPMRPEERVAPDELPLARWPRLAEQQIPHLIRIEGREAQRVAEQAAQKKQQAAAVDTKRKAEAAAQPDAVPEKAPAPSQLDPTERSKIAQEVSAPIVSEMQAMREWMALQMEALSWRDSAQSNPMRRYLWCRMVDAGFTPELARTVAARFPQGFDKDQCERWLVEVLVRNLECVAAEASIVEKGGRYAILGPTGVGKTTTTAKLAAHCVVKYGAGSLGLISTDQTRIGAVDQLRTFGQLLGVEVYVARGAQDLEGLLAGMSDRRLVLIDSAGVGQRDENLARHLSALQVEGVRRLLVLPGATHAEQAEDVINAYGEAGLMGLVVTKLDEAVRLGGVLDAAIRHRVPVHYMTNGQRVPEDIHNANGRLLVHRALRAKNARVFALDAEELDWSCMIPVEGPAGVSHSSSGKEVAFDELSPVAGKEAGKA